MKADVPGMNLAEPEGIGRSTTSPMYSQPDVMKDDEAGRGELEERTRAHHVNDVTFV